MVSEHALPSAAKSADRMDGAMMAGGDMAGGFGAGYGRASVQDEVQCGANGRTSGDGGNGCVTDITICAWC